jgi:hypothetical protein
MHAYAHYVGVGLVWSGWLVNDSLINKTRMFMPAQVEAEAGRSRSSRLHTHGYEPKTPQQGR